MSLGIQTINEKMDIQLSSWAARLAIIEEYETLERTDPDEARQKTLEFAKQEASTYYTKSLIDFDQSAASEILLAEITSRAEGLKEDDAPFTKGFNAMTSRFKMAIFGALALLAPMLIMTLSPTKLTALITTTAFVMVVAVILSVTMTTAENKDILGATAAYAAVLIIFVSTASATGGPSNGVIGAISAGIIVGIVLLFMVLIKPYTNALFWRNQREVEEYGREAEANMDVSVFQYGSGV